MGELTNRIATGIYNGYVRRRNKFVRGDYHVKDKAVKAASYLNSVGNNIAEDVKAGSPKDAFPFRVPDTRHRRNDKHKRRRHRNNRSQQNRYPLI